MEGEDSWIDPETSNVLIPDVSTMSTRVSDPILPDRNQQHDPEFRNYQWSEFQKNNHFSGMRQFGLSSFNEQNCGPIWNSFNNKWSYSTPFETFRTLYSLEKQIQIIRNWSIHRWWPNNEFCYSVGHLHGLEFYNYIPEGTQSFVSNYSMPKKEEAFFSTITTKGGKVLDDLDFYGIFTKHHISLFINTLLYENLVPLPSIRSYFTSDDHDVYQTRYIHSLWDNVSTGSLLGSHRRGVKLCYSGRDLHDFINAQITFNIDYLQNFMFKNNLEKWNPYRVVCFDETIAGFYQSCKFGTCVSNKPTPNGLLFYVGTDSKGFGWYSWMYNKYKPPADIIIKDLCDILPQKGHILVADRYFGSLKSMTHIINSGHFGTMVCSHNTPSFLFQKGIGQKVAASELTFGEPLYESMDNGKCMIVCKFERKSRTGQKMDRTYFITNHNDYGSPNLEGKPCNNTNHYYNTFRSLGDMFDKQTSRFNFRTRTHSWDLAAFKHILKMQMENSRIYFNTVNNQNLSLRQFYVQVLRDFYKYNTGVSLKESCFTPKTLEVPRKYQQFVCHRRSCSEKTEFRCSKCKKPYCRTCFYHIGRKAHINRTCRNSCFSS